jgi:hypothetical protein
MSDLNNKNEGIFKSGIDFELLKGTKVFSGQSELSPLAAMKNGTLSEVFKANEHARLMLENFNSTNSKIGETGIGLLMKQMKEQGGLYQLKNSNEEMLRRLSIPSIGIDSALETEKMIKSLTSGSALKSLLYTSDLKQKVSDNIDLYNSQIKLTQLLYTNPLFVHNNPSFDTNPYIGLNASSYLSENKLSTTDFMSGATFAQVRTIAESDEELKKAYEKIGVLLNDKANLSEIVKLQKTVIENNEIRNLESTQNSEKSKFSIPTLETLFEWFAADILYDKLGLTKQQAFILMLMIYFPIKIASEMVVEGEFGAIYHRIIGDEDASNQVSTTNNIYVNVYKQDDLVDFTTNKAKVYTDNDFKSSRLGFFKTNTKLKILLIENGWCYVEGDGFKLKSDKVKTRSKRKGKNFQALKIRGWVEKKLLTKFQ